MKSLFEHVFNLNGVNISDHRDALTRKRNEPEIAKLEILDYHLKNNSEYHNFVGRQEVVQWNEIPVIRKHHLQSQNKSWISDSYRGMKLFQNSTSGSSGVPLRFTKDWQCHARTWALYEKRYAEHDIDVFRDLEARFYGIPMDRIAAHYKEIVKDMIARRVRFPVFDLSESVLERYYGRFLKQKFVYLNGYTSSLVAFANFIILKKSLTLREVCSSLKACITTSEMCSEGDRLLMERAFGVKVINEYGAAELDIIAFEDLDGDWILNEENLYVEVVDNNDQPLPDGQEGRILVTALFNKAMPFIRYELGDIGVISKKRKKGYRILEKLTGRTNDMAMLPSGKVVPGLTFYYVTKSLLKENGLVREIVVKQHDIDSFEVLYVASRELNASEQLGVKHLLNTYLEQGLRLRTTRVEQIKRQKSGKLKQFENLIK